MGILEKIADIEKEIARTQKNKATEYHLGILKAKLAKYRSELIEIKSGSSEKGEGFDVMKSGDGRVALIGFPSVGKSTLLSKLTETASCVAAYEFTTLTCIPGVIHYPNGAKIQLLDLPGIIEGASQGKGRGKQVIAVARTADLVLIMLDATRTHHQRHLLESELESVGIRLNKQKPNITYRKKTTGGISLTTTLKDLTHITPKLVQHILHEYRIFHAEVIVREDHTVDELIDVIEGNRRYVKCLYCYNKIDQIGLFDLDRLAREPNTVMVSCQLGLGLEHLLDELWEYLGLMVVYTKKTGSPPDLKEGIILRRSSTVEHFCHRIHRSLPSILRYSLVWGLSTKHQPQKVGLAHPLLDGDVIQLVKKK